MQESIAITVFERERARLLLSPLGAAAAAAGPDSVNELQSRLRGLLFPEDRYDDMAHVNKAKRLFKKLEGIDLAVQPFKDNQAGWKRVQ